MLRNKTIGELNMCFGVVVPASAPILTYIVAREYIWHVYFLIIGLYSIVHTIDMWNSDCTARNLVIIRKAGFSEVTIWGSALFMLLGFQLPGIALTLLYGVEYNPDWEIPTWDYFSMNKITWAVIAVMSTDGLFYLMHKVLHEHLPRIHLLHHCCVYSSQNAVLFFHPLDLVIEFSAPTLAVFLLAKYWFQDPWMFALSAAMLNAWYGIIHEEVFDSAHVKHHRGCATGYFVYINYFYANPANELVRKYIPTQLTQKDGIIHQP